MIFRYSSAEKPYSEASTTFQSGYVCENEFHYSSRSSGGKNAAKLPHVV